MTKDRNKLAAGLFMLFTVAAIVLIVLAIAGVDSIFQGWQRRIVTFKLSDDVGGLRIGDEVRVGGYKVGTVDHIDVVGLDTGTPLIRVTFSVPDRFALREGASVRVQQSLTGTAQINIDDLGSGEVLPEEAPLLGRPNPLTVAMNNAGEITEGIKSVTLPRVNDAVGKAGRTAETFDRTGQAATAFVEHLHGKVDPAMQKYNTVADRGAEMMTEVRDLIGDSKGDLRGTAANLNAATGTIKEKLPDIMGRVETVLAKAERSVDAVNATLVDVSATMANAREFSVSAKSILGRNRGRIDSMVASLKATGDNLKGASAEIRRSPWRLLYKPAKGEMANLNLYDSARQFAEGANALSDAATSLRDALSSPQLDQADLQKLMARLQETFENFQKVETLLWKQVRE